MKNFKLLGEKINVQPLFAALSENSFLWNSLPIRTANLTSYHHEVDDIIIRFSKVEGRSSSEIKLDINSVDFPAFDTLRTDLTPIIEQCLQASGNSKVGRCLITKLSPGKKVKSHIDSDPHAYAYKRYHLCISGGAGNTFYCGNEKVDMLTGQFWWFNNKMPHSAVNTSMQDRVHLILDLA